MMKKVSWRTENSRKIPVYVTVGDRESPVWIQQEWDEGEYQLYVRKNGCGHCCAAMALTLNGISIDPHEEYSLCRELWGAPREEENFRQGNFQSISGITKILRHFGVAAEPYGVPDAAAAMEHIERSLKDGKIVIFESHPTEDFPDNPFSPGEHWMMLVGYADDGRLVALNSSSRIGTGGVQLVDSSTVSRALPLGSTPVDMTWGEWTRDFMYGIGYIVVG